MSWCAEGLFEPSEHLWQEWDLILNVNLPLLPSCWGFSFALGGGVSLHSRFSTYHLTGVSLTLGVRYWSSTVQLPLAWFQIGKGVCQGCILSPGLFNFYAEYIIRNAGLEEDKLESRFPGEISITSDMQTTPPLCQKVKKN